jgi:hypothetical protein
MISNIQLKSQTKHHIWMLAFVSWTMTISKGGSCEGIGSRDPRQSRPSSQRFGITEPKKSILPRSWMLQFSFTSHVKRGEKIEEGSHIYHSLRLLPNPDTGSSASLILHQKFDDILCENYQRPWALVTYYLAMAKIKQSEDDIVID